MLVSPFSIFANVLPPFFNFCLVEARVTRERSFLAQVAAHAADVVAQGVGDLLHLTLSHVVCNLAHAALVLEELLLRKVVARLDIGAGRARHLERVHHPLGGGFVRLSRLQQRKGCYLPAEGKQEGSCRVSSVYHAGARLRSSRAQSHVHRRAEAAGGLQNQGGGEANQAGITGRFHASSCACLAAALTTFLPTRWCHTSSYAFARARVLIIMK